MAKKRVPTIIFNDGAYKYPKGLRVVDEDELDTKFESGEWNTGPVDAAKNKSVSGSAEKPLSHMNTTELAEIAGKCGITIENEWKKIDLYNAIKNHKE